MTIIAAGLPVSESLAAAEKLAADGIQARVINMHTIKPLDEEAVIKAAEETGKIVTVEEHSVIGGLGSAVCDVVAQKAPAKSAEDRDQRCIRRVRTCGRTDQEVRTGRRQHLRKSQSICIKQKTSEFQSLPSRQFLPAGEGLFNTRSSVRRPCCRYLGPFVEGSGHLPETSRAGPHRLAKYAKSICYHNPKYKKRGESIWKDNFQKM